MVGEGTRVADYPSSDESFALLQTAGWSDGDVRLLTGEGPVWLVRGTHGERKIETRDPVQAEARHMAVEQAQTLGMLGRSPEGKTP
jgi:hypothetical protein